MSPAEYPSTWCSPRRSRRRILCGWTAHVTVDSLGTPATAPHAEAPHRTKAQSRPSLGCHLHERVFSHRIAPSPPAQPNICPESEQGPRYTNLKSSTHISTIRSRQTIIVTAGPAVIGVREGTRRSRAPARSSTTLHLMISYTPSAYETGHALSKKLPVTAGGKTTADDQVTGSKSAQEMLYTSCPYAVLCNCA